MHARTRIGFAVVGYAVLTGPAVAQSYQHAYQHKYGGDAQFFVEGPATGGSPDVQGDAMLTLVRMPNGDKFNLFYKPTEIRDLQYIGHSGYTHKWLVRGGTRTTVGISGDELYSNYDHSPAAIQQFADLTLQAFNNNNLNNYLDCGSNKALFDFTIGFDLIVKDNDPDPDDFGEILYFERGAGSGNSWLKLQAVDETGAALGPWLVIGPNETLQTTPQTVVMRSDQKMGTTSIDVSRLGVSELSYLRVSNDVTGEPAYTGGGDQSPDFKVMIVMTNKEQLAEAMGMFD